MMFHKTFAVVFHKTFDVVFHKTFDVVFHKTFAVVFHKTFDVVFHKTFAVVFHKTFDVVFHKTFAVMFHKTFAVVFHKTFDVVFHKTFDVVFHKTFDVVFHKTFAVILVGHRNIEPTASYFYTQGISLHSHVLKCLLHALSGCKYKTFTPLRQYDVTGLIYAKKLSTIVISAPKNPGLPVDFSSISYILRISYQTILAKSPWDTFKKL